jgi:hypothetical protein
MAGLLLGSCSAGSGDAFAQTASNLASGMFAAATTLAFVHGGRVTIPYGRAAFVEYRDRLDDVGQQLATVPGNPGGAQARRLARLVDEATKVAEDPCFDPNCPWQAQVLVLQVAGRALLGASSSSDSVGG